MKKKPYTDLKSLNCSTSQKIDRSVSWLQCRRSFTQLCSASRLFSYNNNNNNNNDNNNSNTKLL